MPGKGKGIIFGKISVYSEDPMDKLDDMRKTLSLIINSIGYPEKPEELDRSENQQEELEELTDEEVEEKTLEEEKEMAKEDDEESKPASPWLAVVKQRKKNG